MTERILPRPRVDRELLQRRLVRLAAASASRQLPPLQAPPPPLRRNRRRRRTCRGRPDRRRRAKGSRAAARSRKAAAARLRRRASSRARVRRSETTFQRMQRVRTAASLLETSSGRGRASLGASQGRSSSPLQTLPLFVTTLGATRAAKSVFTTQSKNAQQTQNIQYRTAAPASQPQPGQSQLATRPAEWRGVRARCKR